MGVSFKGIATRTDGDLLPLNRTIQKYKIGQVISTLNK
jgi:hypothetical protein